MSIPKASDDDLLAIIASVRMRAEEFAQALAAKNTAQDALDYAEEIMREARKNYETAQFSLLRVVSENPEQQNFKERWFRHAV